MRCARQASGSCAGVGELGAGGAAACGEVEALGVEPDGPPRRARGCLPSEARELGRAKRIGLGEEPLLGLGQRGFALARDEDLGHGERARPCRSRR